MNRRIYYDPSNSATFYNIEAFSYQEEDMGEATITCDLMLPAMVDPSFSTAWYMDFRGEKFYNKTLQPSAVKDDSSLKYKYSLVFESQRADLKRYEFANFVGASGANQLISYDFEMNASIGEFVTRYNNNLTHNFGAGAWVMVLDASWASNVDSTIYDGASFVLTTFSRTTLWAVLSQLYELYGLRWKIGLIGSIMTITVGANPVVITHEFEYGKAADSSWGGLVSIERVNPLSAIYTRLSGMGSDRNLPYRYFNTSTGDGYPEDPDNNVYTRLIPYTNIMPASYRDYVQGWNDKEYYSASPHNAGNTTAAYDKGYADSSNGLTFNPIDYVEAAVNKLAKWGIRKGSMENNDDIYPTIIGSGEDDAVAVEEVMSDVENPQPLTATVAIVDSATTTYNLTAILDSSTAEFYLAPPFDKISFRITQEMGKRASDINYHTTISVYLMQGGTQIGDELQFSSGLISDDSDIVYNSSFDTLAAGTYYLRMYSTIHNLTVSGDIDTTITLSTILMDVTTPYKTTYDVWIKNIWDSSKGIGETPAVYMHRIWDALLPPTGSGVLTLMWSDVIGMTGDDYEFPVVAIAYSGVGGAEWKLTLNKSDAELDTSGWKLPNTVFHPHAGDHFFFINIVMPFTPYVYAAEQSVDDYLAAELAKVDDEYPTYAIKLSPVFCETFAENNKIAVGVLVPVKNERVLDPSVQNFYINSLQFEYVKDKILPTMTTAVSVKPISHTNSVSLLQGEIKVINRALATYVRARNAPYQSPLTFGIANINAIKIDDVSVGSSDYARFTATGLEGRSYAEVLSDIGAAPVTVANVVSFGAKGDGTTNDTVAIQAAIDSIDSSRGGTVFFPTPINYYLRGILTIEGKTNFTLDGNNALQKLDTLVNHANIVLSGVCDNIILTRLNILGDGLCDNSDPLRIHGHYGIANDSGQTLTNIKITDCVIKSVTIGISVSADLGGTCEDITISGNHVETVMGVEAGTGYGIHVSKCSNAKINDNVVIDANRHSIYCARGGNATIQDNYIKNHRKSTYDADPTSDEMLEPRAAIQIARSKDLIISGNIVESSYSPCLMVGSNELVTLAGTVATSAASKTVLGTGTHFLTGTSPAFLDKCHVGDYMYIGTDEGTIDYITSDTELTLLESCLSTQSGITAKIDTDNAGDITISNNFFIDQKAHACMYVGYLNPETDGYIRNVFISNNTFKNATDTAMLVVAFGFNVKVTDNIFYNMCPPGVASYCVKLEGIGDSIFLSGRVATQIGSTTIEGSGTAFLTECTEGDLLQIGNDSLTISSIVDNDTLTIVNIDPLVVGATATASGLYALHALLTAKYSDNWVIENNSFIAFPGGGGGIAIQFVECVTSGISIIEKNNKISEYLDAYSFVAKLIDPNVVLDLYGTTSGIMGDALKPYLGFGTFWDGTKLRAYEEMTQGMGIYAERKYLASESKMVVYLADSNVKTDLVTVWGDGRVVIPNTLAASTLQSTVATGTAPLTVASTTLVNNFNSQYLNGHADSYFQTALDNTQGTTGTGIIFENGNYYIEQATLDDPQGIIGTGIIFENGNYYIEQAELNGTSFVKISGTTISYDNSTYVTGTPWTAVGYYVGDGSAFATAAQGTLAGTALQSVPDATASVKGIMVLGAAGGAATYAHTHDYSGVFAALAGSLTQDFLVQQLTLAGDEINFGHSTDANTTSYINYRGYNYGVTRFRSLGIYDGKQGVIAFFDGTTGHVGVGYSSGTEITNYKLAINGTGFFNGALAIVGALTGATTIAASGVITSTLADAGDSPFAITSKVLNTNLNAEYLGGHNAAYFVTGTPWTGMGYYIGDGSAFATAAHNHDTTYAALAGSLTQDFLVQQLTLSGDEIRFNHSTDADAVGYINYRGYNYGATRYRDLAICDGKQNTIAYFTGSTKAVTFNGAVAVGSLIKTGGTSSQYLKADGSVTENFITLEGGNYYINL